jgi:LPXTG-motif cell wall-anchored protein
MFVGAIGSISATLFGAAILALIGFWLWLRQRG